MPFQHGPAYFYIIYTPFTVSLLYRFALSLAQQSSAHFCLVANGCSPEERQQLQSLSSRHAQLDYLLLSETETLDHGTSLNRLQEQTERETFGFIDSDIYAVGPFWPPDAAEPFWPPDAVGPFWLPDAVGPFWPPDTLGDAKTAAWQIPAPASYRLADDLPNSHNQIFMGSTYFALYDNHKIRQLRADTGLGFGKYRWEQIPPDCQSQIEAVGLRREKYDTAKVLNILLMAQGYKLQSVEVQTLRHLGGVSRVIQQRDRAIQRSFLPLINAIPSHYLRRMLISLALSIQEAGNPNIAGQSAERKQKRARKRLVNHYFHDLLSALEAGQCRYPKIVRTGEPDIDSRLVQMTEELIALYAGESSV